MSTTVSTLETAAPFNPAEEAIHAPVVVDGPMARITCYLSPAMTIWQCCQLLPPTLREVAWRDILFVNRWKSKWFGNIWRAVTACGEDWEDQRKEVYGGAKGVVLEIGPGTGSSARFYPRASTGAVEHIYLVEPNTSFHGALRDAFGKLGYEEGVSFTLSSELFTPALSSPPDGSVDTVISVLVLCSVSDGPANCKKVYDLLKPGGQFRGFEHVRGKDMVTRFVQWSYNWVWGIPFDNCNLGRPTDEWMKNAGEWRIWQQGTVEGESRYTILPTWWAWAVKA